MLFYFAQFFAVLVCIQVVLFLVAKKLKKLSKASTWLTDFLYWNGLIRFFMEGYLEFFMMSVLNSKALYWRRELQSVTASNVLSFISMTLLIILPIFFMFFYMRNIHKWNKDEF